MKIEASEFLRAVRGTRSQVAFARRLGYRGNPITDWEHGRRYPTAREALRACRQVGIDVPQAFRQFLPAHPLQQVDGEFLVADWLAGLRGSLSVAEVARRIQRSRYSVARWLSGQCQPRVPDFFFLIDAMTGRLADLVAGLVPIESVPSLALRHARARAARTLAFVEPWTEAVLRVIETESYQALSSHRAGCIAERLGIDVDREERCLRLLVEAGTIRHAKGRYLSVGELSVDTRGAPEAMRSLRHHWATVGAQRTLAPQKDDLFAYNVVSVSGADLSRIRERLRDVYREIRAVVAASQPAEEVALLNLELVAFSTSAAENVTPT